MKTSLQHRTLEDRMLLFILVGSIVVSILLIVENLIIDYPFEANYKWAFMFIFASILLYFVLKGLYVQTIKMILFIVYIFILLPVGTLFTGMNNSFAIGYAFLLYIAVSFLFEKKTRIILMVSESFIVMGMLWLTILHPELFLTVSLQAQQSDLIIQVVITFSIAGIILIVFANAYQKEKRILKEYSDLLDKQNKVLEHLSMIDELTQVYNRRYFFNYLNEIRPKTQCLLGMIDIDSFKAINDGYGHVMGDQVLIYISETLRSILGKNGIIARYGGDEFAVVLESSEPKIQRDLILKLSELCIHFEKLNQPVTLSGGFTKYDGVSPIDTVIHKADQLLYQVKSNGKNNMIIG